MYTSKDQDDRKYLGKLFTVLISNPAAYKHEVAYKQEDCL